jgi:hypothetical protein
MRLYQLIRNRATYLNLCDHSFGLAAFFAFQKILCTAKFMVYISFGFVAFSLSSPTFASSAISDSILLPFIRVQIAISRFCITTILLQSSYKLQITEDACSICCALLEGCSILSSDATFQSFRESFWMGTRALREYSRYFGPSPVLHPYHIFLCRNIVTSQYPKSRTEHHPPCMDTLLLDSCQYFGTRDNAHSCHDAVPRGSDSPQGHR